VQRSTSSAHNTPQHAHEITTEATQSRAQVSHLLVPLQALLRALQNSKQDTGRSANMRANKMHELKKQKSKKSCETHKRKKLHTEEKVYAKKNNTMCMKLL
jgi:hypothetical protein